MVVTEFQTNLPYPRIHLMLLLRAVLLSGEGLPRTADITMLVFQCASMMVKRTTWRCVSHTP